jgi:hypothetical protein
MSGARVPTSPGASRPAQGRRWRRSSWQHLRWRQMCLPGERSQHDDSAPRGHRNRPASPARATAAVAPQRFAAAISVRRCGLRPCEHCPHRAAIRLATRPRSAGLRVAHPLGPQRELRWHDAGRTKRERSPIYQVSSLLRNEEKSGRRPPLRRHFAAGCPRANRLQASFPDKRNLAFHINRSSTCALGAHALRANVTLGGGMAAGTWPRFHFDAEQLSTQNWPHRNKLQRQQTWARQNRA